MVAQIGGELKERMKTIASELSVKRAEFFQGLPPHFLVFKPTQKVSDVMYDLNYERRKDKDIICMAEIKDGEDFLFLLCGRGRND